MTKFACHRKFRPGQRAVGGSGSRCRLQGFMDYTEDSCMDFAATRNRQRVTDGTSNTLQIGEA
jgi:hypothetical protein